MDAANQEKDKRNNEPSGKEIEDKIRLEMKKREITRKLKGESR
ncbi:hypothetical protein [Clostridium beijerinckii]|uniref:Uncharacterized protein n=1 Tax=Clostridium beijerinckii TaxID=1520 RepID=A0AAX0B0K5_CLOBE|nr:hypothetical protein [Clostridium beijerinckii]NRT88726.1 hypothetical protein [Clostridium beijerinckii]NYC74181.1 hypothetical protein [Clostridium beijerinckii]